MPSLREDILRECFGPYDGVFAGGQRANNKLDLEKLQHNPGLRKAVGERLGYILMQYEPDTITPVPNGAGWLAEDIAEAHNLNYLPLKKNPTTKKVSFANKAAHKLCTRSARLVIVEDAYTHFTNTRRVLAVPSINRRVVAVGAIWDRGSVCERAPLDIPTHSLLTEYIPPDLPSDSPLWEFAGED